MGYIPSTSGITLEAILTKKGRELLAKGDNSFQITQFALSDDEIDYSLFNPDHPNGSAYFGEAIENLPVLEAFPDDSNLLKYKLITLPLGTTGLPTLSIGSTNLAMTMGSVININPKTRNFNGLTETKEPSGYVISIRDSRLASITPQGPNSISVVNGGVVTPLGGTSIVAIPQQFNSTKLSFSLVGDSFILKATNNLGIFEGAPSLTTIIDIVGKDSGAKLSVPLVVSSVLTTSPAFPQTSFKPVSVL
jgi:hypothetical protein